MIDVKESFVYPDVRFLPLCKQLAIKMTISADAHQPSSITAHYAYAKTLLRANGYDHICVYEQGRWLKKAL